jgi:transcriptional regulator with XRE-family HTH domain
MLDASQHLFPTQCWFTAKNNLLENKPMKNKNFIKDIRDDRGLSLEELAQRMNTTNQQISNLELGKRKLSWDWMQRLAGALECHPMDLVEGLPTAETKQEKELLDAYRGLSDGEQRMFGNMLKSLSDGDHKKQTEKDNISDDDKKENTTTS